MSVLWAVLCGSLVVIQGGDTTGVRVVGTIAVGRAPHGIRFSADGRLAFVALSGDNQVAVVDLARRRVVRRLPAGTTPLDLAPVGSDWLVTQFQGNQLIRLSNPKQPETVGKGPSLFAPRTDSVGYLVSEFADTLSVVDLKAGHVRSTFPTGKRPYPADVTADGVLAFVPNRTDGSVSVIDLLNREAAATVAVCPLPEGGALTADGVSYLVACGGSNEIVYLNTASYRIETRVTGVGPRPFSMAMTGDGRFAVIINAGGSTVSILDVAARRVVGSLPVGRKPIVVRAHPDGRRILVSAEDGGTVTVLEAAPPPPPSRGTAKTPVLMIGTIHQDHRTSTRFGLDVLRSAIEAFRPDLVLTEIAPNRFEQARREFQETGTIVEPRVSRFPEYVDVLFPLSRRLPFEIVPTAGWNAPMDKFRRAALARIEKDPARASEWARYLAAQARSDSAIQAGGAVDDPRWIHTDGWDRAESIYLDVYQSVLGNELGTGGWDVINRAHFANIAQALDRVAGQGKRVLITYGAGHKVWFLKALRQRTDVVLVDPIDYFH